MDKWREGGMDVKRFFIIAAASLFSFLLFITSIDDILSSTLQLREATEAKSIISCLFPEEQ